MKLRLLPLLLLALLLTACASPAPTVPVPEATVQPMTPVQTGAFLQPTSPYPTPRAISSELRSLSDALRETDPSLHGSCYVTDNGQYLHVNLVKGKEDRIDIPQAEGLVLHVVQYSYQDLLEARDALMPYMDLLNIQAISPDVINNQVHVRVNPMPDNADALLRSLVESPEMYYIEFMESVYTPS